MTIPLSLDFLNLCRELKIMPDWKSIVVAHHEFATKNSCDLDLLQVGLPQRDEDIVQIEQSIGFQFPEDMRDFYQTMNGMGSRNSHSGEVSWFIVPMDQISTTMAHCRDWFLETHPKEATRFFPFINWNCGDYTGYLIDGTANDQPLFCTFSHEYYTFDVEQDPSEFFDSSFSNLEDLLGID